MTADVGAPRRRSIPIAAVAALAVVAAIVGGVFHWRHRPADDAPHPAAAAFYAMTLADAGGTQRPMAEHRGKVVVVNFWATWCVPCVQEIPAFSKANAAANGRVGFVGLGIDSPDNIAAFGARFKPSYPLLAAGAGGTDLARAFGDDAAALPFTVVLDAGGRVVASHLGRVDEATLTRWLAPYVDVPTAAESTTPAVRRLVDAR